MVLFQSDVMPIFGTHITIATRAVIWTFLDVMVFTIIGWFSKVLMDLHSFWLVFMVFQGIFMVFHVLSCFSVNPRQRCNFFCNFYTLGKLSKSI